MSRSISKDELKKADQFTQVGRSALEQVAKNQKLVIGVAVALVLGGAGFVALDKVSLNKEMAVQEQYYAIEKNYLKIKEGFEKAEADQKTKAAQKENKDPKNKTANSKNEEKAEESAKLATGDLTKDYGSEVDGWTKLIDSHPHSKAAAMSALELSQVYLKYEKPKEALQILAKVKNQQNSDHFLGAMVFHAYAKLLANQNQCQEAIGVWEVMEKKKKLRFLADEAQLGHALCLETLGQTEKAEMIFKDIVAGKNDSSTNSATPKPKSAIQKSAEKYLRFLKIKKNMGTTPS